VDFSTRRSKARAKDFDTLIRGDAKRFRFLAKPGEARLVPKLSTPPFMATPKGSDFRPKLVRKLLNTYPSSFRRQKNAAHVFPV